SFNARSRIHWVNLISTINLNKPTRQLALPPRYHGTMVTRILTSNCQADRSRIHSSNPLY
ncbi:MAG: hypothetical protein ABGX40_08505, partial [Methylococcales bacterium]